VNRRRALRALGAAVVGALAAACRPRPPGGRLPGGGEGDTAAPLPGDSGGAVCPPAAPGPDWLPTPLAAVPALAEPGGSAEIVHPDAFVQALVAHTDPGCFVGLWRVCSHGACVLVWDAAAREAVCPCHGSRFGPDGAVRVGPATAGLARFPVVLHGGEVWIGPRAGP